MSSEEPFSPLLIRPGRGKVSAAGSAEIRQEGARPGGMKRRRDCGIIVCLNRSREIPRNPSPIIVLAINQNVTYIGNGDTRVEEHVARLGLVWLEAQNR